VQHIRTEAVTYASRDLGEADRIIDFLTRDHGRLSAVARGARRSRKRYGGRLEKFVCVELQVLERAPGALARIEDVRVKEFCPGLSDELDRFSMAEAWLELAGRFAVPGDEGTAGFDELLAVWRVIQQGEMPIGGFYLGLLYALAGHGVMAQVNRCAGCGVPGPLRYIGESGGVLCAACRSQAAKPISALLGDRLTALPAVAQPEDWGRLAGDAPVAELRGAARAALDWYAGGSLRVLQVWEQTLLNR
jgi:DNA repair protein RecO (recombination protein O)